MDKTDLLAKGWECPKCGAVMSPTTSACINCRGITEISVSTSYSPEFLESLNSDIRRTFGTPKEFFVKGENK